MNHEYAAVSHTIPSIGLTVVRHEWLRLHSVSYAIYAFVDALADLVNSWGRWRGAS